MSLAINPISFRAETNIQAKPINDKSADNEQKPQNLQSEPPKDEVIIHNDNKISKEELKEALKELKEEGFFDSGKSEKAQESSKTKSEDSISQKQTPESENKDKIQKQEDSKTESKDVESERKYISDNIKLFVKQNSNKIIKGLIGAVVTGAIVTAGASVVRGLRGFFKNPKTSKFSDIFLHPIKTAGKSGKILAALAALGVFALNLKSAKLPANDKTSNEKLDAETTSAQ